MTATARHRRRMSLETLENREMMTIDLATALATAFVADSLSDDRYEPNDSRSQAAEIGTLTAAHTLSSLKMRDSQDWFRFRVGGGFTGGHVQIDFQHSRGDLDVRLFNAAGSEVGNSTGSGNQERISLAGLPAGEYFVKVYGYNGAHNRDYSLTIHPGTATQPTTSVQPTIAAPVVSSGVGTATGSAAASDDRYEDNDTRGTAANLGTLTSERVVDSLQMRDQHDWFRFRMNGPGRSGDFVRINFQHSRGDLDFELLDSTGRVVGSSTGTGNVESISLANLPAGEYSVHVYGYRGAQNPQYSLTIRPGAAVAATMPASTATRPTTPAVTVAPPVSAGNAGSALGTSAINFGPLSPTAPLPGRPINNPTALSWSGINANGVDLLNSILAPPPTTWAGVAQDPLVQQYLAPRNPATDNGLGYLPWTARSSSVHDLLRSDIAQHADADPFTPGSWNTTMYGGTRPGIYYAVENHIANNFANGATAIDVSGVNRHYGIGDGNLNLLAQVSPGAFGPQTPNRGVPIPMFQQWGWGAPIG